MRRSILTTTLATATALPNHIVSTPPPSHETAFQEEFVGVKFSDYRE